MGAFGKFFDKLKRGVSAPLHYPLLSIIQQTIAAIVSLIYNSEASPIIFISESKEGVIQQIHLQHSFFSGHRLEVELFGAHDIQVFLLLVRGEGCFFLNGAAKCALLQAACRRCQLRGGQWPLAIRACYPGNRPPPQGVTRFDTTQ